MKFAKSLLIYTSLPALCTLDAIYYRTAKWRSLESFDKIAKQSSFLNKRQKLECKKNVIDIRKHRQ